jgi:hypothetical protein
MWREGLPLGQAAWAIRAVSSGTGPIEWGCNVIDHLLQKISAGSGLLVGRLYHGCHFQFANDIMYGRAKFDLLRLRVLSTTPPSKQEKGTSTAEPAANRGARQKAAHVQTSRAA